MIESNLSVLLAERNLRISKVSSDTGISRTTLTALCNDYTGGIKFDTLDVLCKYLKIEPAEFFNFTPYEYNISLKDEDGMLVNEDIIEFTYHFNLNVIKDNCSWTNDVAGFAVIDKEKTVSTINCFFEIENDDSFESEKAFEHLEQMVNEMSQRQRKELDNALESLMGTQIKQGLRTVYKDDDINPTISYSGLFS